MAIEIERKFLIADESWKHSVVCSVHIRDGLIANDNDRKVRVRIYDKSATITLKGHHAGITRAEFEYPQARFGERTVKPLRQRPGFQSDPFEVITGVLQHPQ